MSTRQRKISIQTRLNAHGVIANNIKQRRIKQTRKRTIKVTPNNQLNVRTEVHSTATNLNSNTNNPSVVDNNLLESTSIINTFDSRSTSPGILNDQCGDSIQEKNTNDVRLLSQNVNGLQPNLVDLAKWKGVLEQLKAL
jgi:hypothetical protein